MDHVEILRDALGRLADDELQARLGISRWTLWRWKKEGIPDSKRLQLWRRLEKQGIVLPTEFVMSDQPIAGRAA